MPFTVINLGGTQNLTINQKTGGGAWFPLGVYYCNAGGTIGGRVSNAGTNGIVIADALRVVQAASTPADVIVDNVAATGLSLTGLWLSSNSISGFYGSDYLHDDNVGKGTKSALSQSSLPSCGNYSVFVRYTSSSNRASNVPIDITYSSGVDSVLLNPRCGGGTWVLLGSYPFQSGTNGSLQISNAGTNGVVVVDAVRFLKP